MNVRLVGAVTLVLLGAVSASAQTATPILQLSMLQNRGSAATPGPDGLPLYQRFTQMLLFAFSAEAQNSGSKSALPFVVRAPQSKNKIEPSVRYVLEGDLSGSGKDQGPYLCVLRLRDTQADGGSRVIAQWAGTARSLRDLSGNLARDPRVHTLGLAGDLVHQTSRELRQRIAAGDAAATIDTFASRVRDSKSEKLVVEAVPEGGTEAATVIAPGMPYRLRITSAVPGTVAVFSLADPAHPVAAFAQDADDMASASSGTSLLLPAKRPLVMESGKQMPVYVAVLTRTGYDDLILPPSYNGSNPPPVFVLAALPKRAPDDPSTDALALRLLTLWLMRKTNPISSVPLTIRSALEETKVP